MSLEGVATRMGPEAVVVIAERELVVLSSAVVGGGFVRARSILNVHVPKNFLCADAAGTVAVAARRLGVPAPWVGLLTGAWTERAETASAEADDVRALAVTTVGLSNPSAAGLSPRAEPLPATINTIAVVDADPEPAALVNLVVTLTEVKTDVLRAAGVRCDDGRPATGTSSDAVVVAATGRGARCRYGGPLTALGWAAASATRVALESGVRRWLADRDAMPGDASA
ncbi:MAG TPA: adenosylcobinamide amidohydrolase [Methylomirabilota bacterium]